MPDGGIEYESFTVISVDSLLVYISKHYVKACLYICAYKIIGKQMIDYLYGNRFNADDS